MLLVLVLLPILARADGINLLNGTGVISVSNTGITANSVLNSVGKPDNGDNLGTVSFATGALISGTLLGGGNFSAIGSSFVVTTPSSALFSGSFVGPITWTPTNTRWNIYTLRGTVTGMLFNGRTATGTTAQSFTLTPGGDFILNGGNTHLSGRLSTPEPTSLILIATGLCGIAGVVRRKKAQ